LWVNTRQKLLSCLIDLLHFRKLARVLPDEDMGARQAPCEFRIEFELFFYALIRINDNEPARHHAGLCAVPWRPVRWR
jgi:hypothetical protein